MPTCKSCHFELSPNARACSRCGTPLRAPNSSPEPDDTFDYDDFIRREFGHQIRPSHISPFWWIVAILTLIAFAALALLAF
jgi:hypothetical protein